MIPSRSYDTSAALEQAINHKIRDIAKSEGNQDLPRIRRQIAFERFLTRLFLKDRETWVLKGGYALELRLHKARATKDIDLCLRARVFEAGKDREQVLLFHMQEASQRDTGDFFSFIVPPSNQRLIGPEFGGLRFAVTAMLNGKPFARFHVDVSIADPVLEPVDVVAGKNWLSFAGFPAETFPTIPKEQQFAEKLHAYTKPRKTGFSSRVRDLMDLFLLIDASSLDPDRVRAAIRLTFQGPSSHPFSSQLSSPHESWKERFTLIAKECGVPVQLEEAFARTQKYVAGLGIKDGEAA